MRDYFFMTEATTTKKVPKPMSRAGSMKPEILKVAARMFMELGYKTTTYQRIADELGISKAAISYHFNGKAWIVFDIFNIRRTSLRDYIRDNIKDDFNEFLYVCTAQICFYREIINSEPIRELFYTDEHLCIWEFEHIALIEAYMRRVANDFHKNLSDEELRAAAVMNFGAKMGMFREAMRSPDSIDADKHCRHLCSMIGLLLRLDEMTIQKNIKRAFNFANTHKLPKNEFFN